MAKARSIARTPTLQALFPLFTSLSVLVTLGAQRHAESHLGEPEPAKATNTSVHRQLVLARPNAEGDLPCITVLVYPYYR